MRAPRISVCLLLSIAVLPGSVLAGASAGAAAVAHTANPVVPVAQTQTGLAFGDAQVIVGPGSRQTDSGNYAATGQLGRGRYVFQSIVDLSRCTRKGDRANATGTATLIRSDGATLNGTVTGSEDCIAGDPISATFKVALAHGSRDLVGAQLAFAGKLVLHLSVDSDVGTESFSFTGTSSATARIGYWMVASSGGVSAFGGVEHLGDAPTTRVADLETTPSGEGYWVVNDGGQVYAYGDARYFGGAAAALYASGGRVTSISATPDARGYWLFTSDGHALRFGDAQLFGDVHRINLAQPIVGSIATPTGNGYYMVARDGGVFAFGDARFHGSMGGIRLNQPIVGIVPTADNAGYWLVAADGGVFSFNAPFRGSMGAVRLQRPIVTMVPYGGAYLMIASDGGVFNFSHAPFFGSSAGTALPAPIVNGAAVG